MQAWICHHEGPIYSILFMLECVEKDTNLTIAFKRLCMMCCADGLHVGFCVVWMFCM